MILLLTILFPIISGIIISIPEMENRKRHIFYVAALFITDILGAITILNGGSARLFAFTDKVSAYFTTDGIGRYFMIFVMLLYTVACFYSFEYMKMEERENVFFAFYFVCFGAMLAVCLAGNLVTLYLCFEMATLTSMPLVLHEMTKAAVSAALKYLFYSIGGALLGLLAVFFVTYFSADPGAFPNADIGSSAGVPRGPACRYVPHDHSRHSPCGHKRNIPCLHGYRACLLYNS